MKNYKKIILTGFISASFLIPILIFAQTGGVNIPISPGTVDPVLAPNNAQPVLSPSNPPSSVTNPYEVNISGGGSGGAGSGGGVNVPIKPGDYIPPIKSDTGAKAGAGPRSGDSGGGLVPKCNPVGPRGAPGTCNLCHILELVKNLITFLLEIGVVFAGLFIAWGAFVIMTAGGSEERVAEGKKIMTTVVWGLVIAFSSFLILGTLIQIVTGSPSALPWTEIKCAF